jgi:Integrase core domain
MGSLGDCFDNAMCESFFATLECELLDRRRFKTQIEARMAIFEFIEGWYNNAATRRSTIIHRSTTKGFTNQQILTASPTPSTERVNSTWRRSSLKDADRAQLSAGSKEQLVRASQPTSLISTASNDATVQRRRESQQCLEGGQYDSAADLRSAGCA